MSSCASLLPLQLVENPRMEDVTLSPLPYTAKWQKSDRFDGELEEGFSEQGMVQAKVLRRPLVPVVEAYVDGHARRAMDAAGDTKLKVRELPLTGAVMSRLPHYRFLPCVEGRCGCRICQKKSAEYDSLRTGAVQAEVEAAAFRDAFSEDVRAVCCLAGHLHEHQSTCFKYAPEGSRRKPQHCRFNFTRFVSLPFTDEETGKTRLRVVARTGKEPKLPPCGPGTLRGSYWAGLKSPRLIFLTESVWEAAWRLRAKAPTADGW